MTQPSSAPKMLTSPTFSVVVPVFNAEATLPELYRRLVSTMEAIGGRFELIFVEDCGSDGSWQELLALTSQDHRLQALQMMRNSGQGNATLAGIQAADGELIITLDDDLQHPPEEIPPLVQTLVENDGLDVVIGVPAVKRHHFVRRLGSWLLNQANSRFLQKDPDLRFTGFRVMRRVVAKELVRQHPPYPAIGPMLISITPRIANVTVRHDARKQGRSGYNLRKLFKQTLANLIGYSVLPLHLLAAIGAAGIVISALVAIYFVIRYFTYGIGVPGWTTLLVTLLAISGFNFFAFGILGEYILRISQATEQRNQRAVRQTTGGRCAVVGD